MAHGSDTSLMISAVNRVLLECSTHVFTYCLWLLLQYDGRVAKIINWSIKNKFAHQYKGSLKAWMHSPCIVNSIQQSSVVTPYVLSWVGLSLNGT